MKQNHRSPPHKKSGLNTAHKAGAAIVPALTDLPPRDTMRWVSRHKAAVVVAVQNGVISLTDACKRYRLSVEEFLNWEEVVAKFGTEGLRANHAQENRRPGRH